jgi:hypothetical protein
MIVMVVKSSVTICPNGQFIMDYQELAEKALFIKTNWITVTIFSRLLFQLVGWFDEVMQALFWVHTLLKEMPTLASISESYADNVVQRDFRVHNIGRDDMWKQRMNSNWSKKFSIVWFHRQDVAFVLGDM